MNRLIAFGLFVLVFVPPLAAQNIGDKLIVIADDQAELNVDGKVVGTIPRGIVLQIKKIEGDTFLVEDWHRTEGWIHRCVAIPVDQAITYCNSEIEKDAKSANYVLRGIVWREKGEHDQALADFNEAIRIDPNDSMAYYNRAIVRSFPRDREKAFDDCTEAIRLDPKNWMAYSYRGQLWKVSWNFDKAIDDFTQVIRHGPRNSFAYYHRADTWSKMGEFDKSVNDFTEAIQIEPANATLYFARGVIWEEKDNLDKAIDDFAESLRLNPDLTNAHWHLAWIYSTSLNEKYLDGKKAVEHATKVCEQSEWQKDLNLELLAFAYAEKGQFDKAIKWLTTAMELAPDHNVKRRDTALRLFLKRMPYRE